MSPNKPCNPLATSFMLTDWDMIGAVKSLDPAEAQKALAELCEVYRAPLYNYLRQKGHGPEAADDLIQQFFESRVINRRIFEDLSPARGRFRSWLLTCLKNMVNNELERQHARKRGGGVQFVSADNSDAEARYLADSNPALTPEALYDRSWAEALVDSGVMALGLEYSDAGRGALFEELKQFLPGAQGSASYADVAERLGMQTNAVRAAVSKLNKRCGEHMFAQVRRTVSGETEAGAEFSYLLGLLSS